MSRKGTTPVVFDGEDYRKGALERLDDASILLRAGQFAGSASNAGRAVEGMLRAVIWKRDRDVHLGKKPLETGHNLRELLTHVANLGLLRQLDPLHDELQEMIVRIAQRRFNNMRFASTKFVECHWLRLGEVRKGMTMKQATQSFYIDCQEIIRRCEVLCRK